jgi:OOP family OmpA-OmpF porin
MQGGLVRRCLTGMKDARYNGLLQETVNMTGLTKTIPLAAEAFLLSCLAFCFTLPEARAQDVSASFSVQNFRMAAGSSKFLTIDGGKVGQHLQFTVEMLDVFQYKPFILVNCAQESEEGKCQIEGERIPVVEYHDSLEVAASLSIFKWFEMGIVLPFTVYQKGTKIDPATATAAGDLESFGGVGDPRLHLKLRLYGEPGRDGLGLALVPIVSFPVGGYGPWGKSYVGDTMVTVHGKLALDYTWMGLQVGINVGYYWREKIRVYATNLEDQFTYGLGIGYRAHLNVGFMAEIFGSVPISRQGYYEGVFSDNRSEIPLEADGALAIYPIKDIRITVGGGAGILAAIGSPMFRVFLGLAYAPVPKEQKAALSDDRDGDTIPNKKDKCPDEPEDFDKFEDEDGCPDLDNDKDGVPDGYDSCPLEPEDKDGFEDDDGCPDVDQDKDGVLDEVDKCIDEPEDMDGFQDEDGCPDPDNDKDGLCDPWVSEQGQQETFASTCSGVDLCPDEAEDKDGFQDEDGCPDPDNDGDGILDKDDKCPDEPEIYNGVKDEDGCPDKGKALVIITETQLEIKQQVNFKVDSDEIKGKMSFKILDIVAAILKAHPSVKVEIQGHTDDTGTREHNLDLSQRRAESVKKYLVDSGIEEGRLVPKGYGPDVPIASNKTKQGKAKNRRVEFHIIVEGAPAEEPAELKTL